ncbi:MAG: flagellar export protein FliJ [Gammaproteobacteria bacterium]|nr:flagellar export protein FliJ [Gammaproteobacteria bacterium]MDP2140843.1 flagellar export protein FliJ [Gammaproteobacteria bacterium]MDP2349414.1 flagellar export protein FliJ [Gammaproteobacteria bacterium]
MKRSRRLNVVVGLALRKAQESARALAYVQEKLRSEEQKLKQLEHYLLEYRSTQHQQGTQGISAQQFMNYNRFSANIEHAIEQQKQQIDIVTRQVEQVRQHWQALDARYKGLEKLRDRLVQEENAAQERVLQKEQDEFASRRHGKSLWP